jgi:double-strand break repair protein AddB
MFEPNENPRVFHVPIGTDFSTQLVKGIQERMAGKPPEAMARLTVYVNTRRTERRIKSLFLDAGAALLPKIKLIDELARDPIASVKLPAPVSGLRRRLMLAQAVRQLLLLEKDLAPLSATFDLADNLAALLDEFQGENVPFESLDSLVDFDASGHWERARKFLAILAAETDAKNPTDAQARLRAMAEALLIHWIDEPTQDPVIIAGSTGSRGATLAFMKAVLSLPQGAVVIPGFDTCLSPSDWSDLTSGHIALDHPQAVLAKMLVSVGAEPADIESWSQDSLTFDKSRNELISLALCPAPVTNKWLEKGPSLQANLVKTTRNIALMEAQNQSEEALSIAICLRKAAEQDQRAVLITPDGDLSRRVTTILTRWGIDADASAGQPLHLTAVGIFLRLTAKLMLGDPSPQDLIALLKHPLSASANDNEVRGNHLLYTRELEKDHLRGNSPIVDFPKMQEWAAKKIPEMVLWVANLEATFKTAVPTGDHTLTDWLNWHRTFAERVNIGLSTTTDPSLWNNADGEEAMNSFASLETNADAGGKMDAATYQSLIRFVLQQAEVRDSRLSHPKIAIWGTLEARVQGADLVILGGLNEDTWPKLPKPDPWLNRAMRKQIGLPLPERRIGLSAHDFQQASAAPNIVFSRSVRDGEAPRVASRWISRLLNLINGLGDEGKASLDSMRDRGKVFIDLARTLDRPNLEIAPEPRPSPRPPVSARPKKLFATQITGLIRSPYDIYARYILGFKRLDPLRALPDARDRGIVFHKILEEFNKETNISSDNFLRISETVLNEELPWPSARALWLGRIKVMAQTIVTEEIERRKTDTIIAQEAEGSAFIELFNFTLAARADRIDRAPSGGLIIYDYKSGNPPSTKEVYAIEKQLPLEAMIALRGGFEGITTKHIEALRYIVLKGEGSSTEIPLEYKDQELLAKCWDELMMLIAQYEAEETGYTARDRPQKISFDSDYDHLSRYGEWTDSDVPDPKVVP